MGEWVDPERATQPSPAANLPEVTSGGWVVSSFDLLSGTEVTDTGDTIPDALFDELFAPARNAEDDPGAV